MSLNLRYPNIKPGTEREQITQIRSYLHQLVEQLNIALPNVSTENGTQSASSGTYEVQGEGLNYYDLRTLIMQEIQQIDQEFDKLSQSLQGQFVPSVGWDANKVLGTDGSGAVVAKDFDTSLTDEEVRALAVAAASKISFTLDEEGNLYYEVEE